MPILPPISEIISKIAADSRCAIVPLNESEKNSSVADLPDDLKEFYSLCNGVELFKSLDYGFRIVSLREFSDPAFGERIYEPCEVDGEIISFDWRLIADNWGTKEIALDLSPNRLGMTYDCYLGADFQIITHSFISLLEKMFGTNGGRFPWLDDG